MNEELKNILKKGAVEYVEVLSKEAPRDNAGAVIALKNYYPKEDEGLNLSIALSQLNGKWDSKCWLSVKEANHNRDPSKPLPHSTYHKFKYQNIAYYPYSIDTNGCGLLAILKLCDGLYKFIKEESDGKK
jgi:hypothetical protein